MVSQYCGSQRYSSSGGLLYRSQLSGFGGLQLYEGAQPQVRSDLESSLAVAWMAAAPVAVGTVQVLIFSMTVDIRVSVCPGWVMVEGLSVT